MTGFSPAVIPMPTGLPTPLGNTNGNGNANGYGSQPSLSQNPYTWPLPGLPTPQQLVPGLANGGHGNAKTRGISTAPNIISLQQQQQQLVLPPQNSGVRYAPPPAVLSAPTNVVVVPSAPQQNPYTAQPYIQPYSPPVQQVVGIPQGAPPYVPHTVPAQTAGQQAFGMPPAMPYGPPPPPYPYNGAAPLVNVSCQCGAPAACQCPPPNAAQQPQQQQLPPPSPPPLQQQQSQSQQQPPPLQPQPPQQLMPPQPPPASQAMGPQSLDVGQQQSPLGPTGQAGPLGLPQDNYPLTRSMVERWSRVLDGPSSHPERPTVAREISEFLLAHPEVTLEGKPRAIMERLVVNLLSTGRTGNDTQVDDSIERDLVLLSLQEGGFYNLPPSIVQVLQQLASSGTGLHGMEQNLAQTVLAHHQQGKDKPAAALLQAYESRWPAWKSNQAVPTQGKPDNALEANSYQGIQQGVSAQPDAAIKRGGDNAKQSGGWLSRLFGPRQSSEQSSSSTNQNKKSGNASSPQLPSSNNGDSSALPSPASQPLNAMRMTAKNPAYLPAAPNVNSVPAVTQNYGDWLTQWQAGEGVSTSTPFTQPSSVIPGLTMLA